MTKTSSFARALKVLALTAVPSFLLAQEQMPQPNDRERSKPFVNSDKDTGTYDKHDFNGFWVRNPSAQYNEPPCPECRDPGPSYGFFGNVPTLTAAGQERLMANRPTKGYMVGSKQAEEHSYLNIAYRKAVQSSESNDPVER